MATYAISDVQGCAATLDRLLARLPLRAGDRLWFVGDLVNRGPASAAVLRTVRDLGERAVVVLGNHDLHLLARAAGLVAAKKRDTIDDVLAATDRDQLCAWLRARPILYREGDTVLVHGGVPPAWTAAAAHRLAQAAAAALAGPQGLAIAAACGRIPDRPPEALEGNARHAAVIVNAVDDVDANLRLVDVVQEHFPNLRMIVRARNVTHWLELRARGVSTIERETFESALVAGRRTLEALGVHPYEARERGDRFRRHNLMTMESLRTDLADEHRAAAVRAAREELARQFEQDHDELERQLGSDWRRADRE